VCATQQVVDREAHPQLDFLKEGVTTKEDVLLKLGIRLLSLRASVSCLPFSARERKRGLVSYPGVGYRDARLAPVRSSWEGATTASFSCLTRRTRLGNRVLLRSVDDMRRLLLMLSSPAAALQGCTTTLDGTYIERAYVKERWLNVLRKGAEKQDIISTLGDPTLLTITGICWHTGLF